MPSFFVKVLKIFQNHDCVNYLIESRETLRERGLQYLASINTSRWSHLWRYLKADLSHVGDFRVLWQKIDQEAAMVYRDHKKAFCLLTNAFSPQQQQDKLTTPPFRAEYKEYFNLCDTYNHYFKKNRFPHKQVKWTHRVFSDLMQMCIINAWVLYNEVNLTDQSLDEYIHDLVVQMCENQ